MPPPPDAQLQHAPQCPPVTHMPRHPSIPFHSPPDVSYAWVSPPPPHCTVHPHAPPHPKIPPHGLSCCIVLLRDSRPQAPLQGQVVPHHTSFPPGAGKGKLEGEEKPRDPGCFCSYSDGEEWCPAKSPGACNFSPHGPHAACGQPVG